MKHKGLRKESVDEKTGYNKVSYAVKKEMITKIVNGQTSKRQAAFEYNVSRSTIDYWFKKFTTTNQKKQFMSKNDELKKLKAYIEELEFAKEFQQEVIAAMEIKLGKEVAKKSLPKQLADEIAVVKKKLLK